MYSLKAIILEHCPYCIGLKKLLSDNEIPIEYTIIEYKDKDKFKTTEINTFPQVYLQRNNSKNSLLIGGFDTMKEIIDIILLKKLDIIKKKLSKKFPEWSDKTRLRLIQLLLNTILPS